MISHQQSQAQSNQPVVNDQIVVENKGCMEWMPPGLTIRVLTIFLMATFLGITWFKWFSKNVPFLFGGALVFVIAVFVRCMYAKRPIFFHPDFAFFYAVLLCNTPPFVGLVTMSVFNLQKEGILRFSLTVGYIVVMQTYFFILGYCIQFMTGTSLYPRFYFVGQLYYYAFWYAFLNSAPIDASFFFMMALMNLHYILTNTGLYGDIIGWLGKKWAVCCGKAQPETQAESAYQRDLFFWLVWRIKMGGQDNLSDLISLIVVPVIGYTMKSVGAPINFSLDDIWIRFGTMVGFRIISAVICKILFSKKVKYIKIEMMIWSVFGDQREGGQSNSISLGTDALERRNVYKKLDEFLRSQGVSAEDIPCFTQRFLEDLNFISDDPTDRRIKYHAMTEENFRHSFWFFLHTTIMVMFGIYRSAEMSTRFSLYVP
eukprot:TRINITY_DN11252_c0_g1_i5.p1 TRINITY_DN11252_c0_g1~~TRINITY_DN11252_c0_g1_i5.p1  ORF type:complete len:428 (+),score=105.22 TRINITY_DN11252_c0_g1_i5:288-1571(+)